MFPAVDLSRMLEKPKCAIHVASLEEAKIVIANAKNQFPDRVKRWDIEAKNFWNAHRENTGYTLFYEGYDEPSTMSYTYISWFKDNGYEIVEFGELLGATVDIEESDQPVDILFGGAL